MSYRLAKQGHAPVAVDLMTNDQDGLAAAEHYKQSLPSLFPRFQAELDNLPFADGQFDLVIFNASFHYSENYEKTMAEALRCTRRNGTVIIADTPWYRDEKSGRRMLEERRAVLRDSLWLSLRRPQQPRIPYRSAIGRTWNPGLVFVGGCMSPITEYGGRCGPGWQNYAANASRPSSEST